MQRRSRGRIAIGSTDKVTAIQASLSLRLNGSENQSQVAESILPRQACPARAALGWPDHSPEKPMRETVPACCAPPRAATQRPHRRCRLHLESRALLRGVHGGRETRPSPSSGRGLGNAHSYSSGSLSKGSAWEINDRAQRFPWVALP
jgi:hypothetical protein